MKKLRVFAHQTEAQLAKSLLVGERIRTELLTDSLGNYTVLVGENDLAAAKKIIDENMSQDMIFAKPAARPNHFKKAVMYALGAPLLVPVVFNFISLQHAYKYWENSHKETDDLLKVLLIVALNIPTYFIIKYAFSMVGNIGSMMGMPEGAEF